MVRPGFFTLPRHEPSRVAEAIAKVKPSAVKYWVSATSPPQVKAWQASSPNTIFVMVDGAIADDKFTIGNLPRLGSGLVHRAKQDAAGYAKWRDIGFPGVAMTLNEPHIWDGETYRKAFVEYSVAFLEEAHRLGLNVCSCNFSVGWPYTWLDSQDWWPQFAPIVQAMATGDYLGLHEYWPKEGPDNLAAWPWLAGRHMLCPYDVPVLISECGMDQNTVDPSIHRSGAGWRRHLSPAAYVEQLRRYHGMLDHRVKGTCIFLLDYENNEWESHDIRYCLDEIMAQQWTGYQPFQRDVALPEQAAVSGADGWERYAAPVRSGAAVYAPARGRVFRYGADVVWINAGWGALAIGPVAMSVQLQQDVNKGQQIATAKSSTLVIGIREYASRSFTRVEAPNLEEQIRNAVINDIGKNKIIAYNPTAALTKRAREMGLGAPLTNEIDVGSYRAQGFAAGILFCRVGDWGDIKKLVY
jgi:hypothetical protein